MTEGVSRPVEEREHVTAPVFNHKRNRPILKRGDSEPPLLPVGKEKDSWTKILSGKRDRDYSNVEEERREYKAACKEWVLEEVSFLPILSLLFFQCRPRLAAKYLYYNIQYAVLIKIETFFPAVMKTERMSDSFRTDLFPATDLIAGFNMNIAVILTFGLASPVLAGVVVLDILQSSLYYQLVICRHIREMSEFWKVEQKSISSVTEEAWYEDALNLDKYEEHAEREAMRNLTSYLSRLAGTYQKHKEDLIALRLEIENKKIEGLSVKGESSRAKRLERRVKELARSVRSQRERVVMAQSKYLVTAAQRAIRRSRLDDAVRNYQASKVSFKEDDIQVEDWVRSSMSMLNWLVSYWVLQGLSENCDRILDVYATCSSIGVVNLGRYCNIRKSLKLWDKAAFEQEFDGLDVSDRLQLSNELEGFISMLRQEARRMDNEVRVLLMFQRKKEDEDERRTHEFFLTNSGADVIHALKENDLYLARAFEGGREYTSAERTTIPSVGEQVSLCTFGSGEEVKLGDDDKLGCLLHQTIRERETHAL
eukprot:gene1409-1605_t